MSCWSEHFQAGPDERPPHHPLGSCRDAARLRSRAAGAAFAKSHDPNAVVLALAADHVRPAATWARTTLSDSMISIDVASPV